MTCTVVRSYGILHELSNSSTMSYDENDLSIHAVVTEGYCEH